MIYNTSLTELNGYKGGITQESSSGIVTTVRPLDLDFCPPRVSLTRRGCRTEPGGLPVPPQRWGGRVLRLRL